MDSDFYKELPDFDIDGLLRDAVAEVLSHEDPQRFLAWLQRAFSTYFCFDAPILADETVLRSMTTTLGRAIWNAIPLPGNHFCPKTLPQPERGRPCLCGSGDAYSRCCGRLQNTVEIESTALWPLVLDHVPEQTRKRAVRSGRVPVEVIINVANEFQDNGHSKKAAVLLELLFEGDIDTPDEAHDFALNALCNCYDDLGYIRKKMKLLQRMIETLPRSPLRAGAWQRLSAIHMDEDDIPAAWNAFHIAQRDDPDSLGIGVLELQLLVADNKIEQARQRAKFWVRRFRKLGYADDVPPMDHLLGMAKDPLDAMTDIGMSITGGAGERLQVWLERVTDRALPRYEIGTERQHLVTSRRELYTAFGDHLRQMGVSRTQSDASVARINLTALDSNPQLRSRLILRQSRDKHGDLDSANAVVGLVLVPPQHVSALSQRWREVFPLGKPLSVLDEAFGSEYAWELHVEEAWSTFLAEHPQAFDSLDILDDLATALMQHPQFGAQWLDHILLAPVLNRAHNIVAESLVSRRDAKLIWGFTENRPILRSLARLALLHTRMDEEFESEQLMQWLLALNPEDNHGFRRYVMNGLLRRGENEKALALSARFPDDDQIETCWGRVLALYRLGKTEHATHALIAALSLLPKVLRQITHERVRKPRMDAVGLQVNDDQQAWIYRQAMRQVWKSTPGVMAWLKTTAKSIHQGMQT